MPNAAAARTRCEIRYSAPANLQRNPIQQRLARVNTPLGMRTRSGSSHHPSESAARYSDQRRVRPDQHRSKNGLNHVHQSTAARTHKNPGCGGDHHQERHVRLGQRNITRLHATLRATARSAPQSQRAHWAFTCVVRRAVTSTARHHRKHISTII